MDEKDRVGIGDVGHPGFIELEDGLRGLAGEPLGLGIAEGVQVEVGTLGLAVTAGDREIVGIHYFGEPGAGRIPPTGVMGVFLTHWGRNILRDGGLCQTKAPPFKACIS